MTAGHWMPGRDRNGGGRALLSERGARSRYVAWADAREADPDVLAVADYELKEEVPMQCLLTTPKTLEPASKNVYFGTVNPPAQASVA